MPEPSIRIVTGEHAIEDCSIPTRLKDSIPGRVLIEDDCWIGANTMIVSEVGTGSVIGANSVVTRDIHVYMVAADTPVRVIQDRGDLSKPK